MGDKAKTVLGWLLGGLVMHASAAWITNHPVADTSLLEIQPANNNGGQAFVISGHLQNPARARALVRFDLTHLPTNTFIQSVILELACTRQPGDGLANSAFSLHRMLCPWGEGDKVAVDHPGQGLPATEGEATWLHRFYPTNAWSAPGGEPNVDFVGSESSFQYIYGAGQSYRFESSPEFVADVQGWVSDPPSNFGWILIAQDEFTPFTARHFGSRENPDAQPGLEIELLVPPRIESAQRVGDQFQFTFNTWPGHTYEAQFWVGSPTNSWQTLTNLGTSTNAAHIVVTDSMPTTQRFYRINAY